MAPHPVITAASSGGVRLAVHHLLAGVAGDPAVLLAHATGFCGPIWEPVTRRLDGVDAWAVDFRAHGRSSRPTDGDLDWNGTCDDVVAAVEAVRPDQPFRLGVGHSMGGAALLMAEISRPGTFEALWLYEPIVFPPSFAIDDDPAANVLAVGAARRRPGFASLDAARDNYRSKPPMASWDPEALDAYLEGGFAVAGDGAVTLRCSPADESQVFLMGSRHHAFDHLAEVRCPVTVVRGAATPGPAEFAPPVADALPAGRLVDHPGLSHFGPMEDPGLVADAIRLVVRGAA